MPEHDTVPILFPVIDILNHSVTAKAEWDFQPHKSFSLKLLDHSTFTPGQELFNNYAPKQNDELLLGYGFCLEDNPIEQFPLKLAFPPMLQRYAQETGLFEPENVPFDISTDFLTKDPNTEQHFLRAKNHPFGRYTNVVPFFRGIPPYIIHFFFIQTLLSLDLDVQEVNIKRPGPRITLQVLTLLHQALTQRCATLPLTIDAEPRNEKHKYAMIYRNGQARIIHSVKGELEATINCLRSPSSIEQPRLVIAREALAELPGDAKKRFEHGMKKHDMQCPADDRMVWTLVLVCAVAWALTSSLSPDSLMKEWLQHLSTRHSLPALEDGIEDADTYTFVDSHLSDFLHLPGTQSGADVLEALDDVGEKWVGGDRADLVNGRTENLGARVLMWAMKVIEAECVPVVVSDEMGMGILFGGEGDSGQSWMYED